ncbi:hypothetical protein ES705_09985 [subsurface metagenome]
MCNSNDLFDVWKKEKEEICYIELMVIARHLSALISRNGVDSWSGILASKQLEKINLLVEKAEKANDLVGQLCINNEQRV